MKNNSPAHRRALVLLLTATALPLTPALAQDLQPAPNPAPTPAPVIELAPASPVVSPPPAARDPAPSLTPTPESPPAEAETTTRSTRSTERSVRSRPQAQAARRPAPARTVSAPADVQAPEPAAAPAPAPTAALPATPATPAVIPPAAVAPEAAEDGQSSILPWLIGGALLLALAAFLFTRRRSRAEARDEVYYDEPVIDREPVAEPMPVKAAAAAPVAAAPFVAPTADRSDEVERYHPVESATVAEPVAELASVDVTDADSADVAALAADSSPTSDRPWLEFLLRPIRAGTTRDEARVEFELTVGNTGGTEARDVRISSWMFSAGTAEPSEMERMLIDPPAEARLSEVNIPAGDGAKVEAAMALAKAGLSEAVLPVVVADARYTLPDGSEGRTTAAFEIGLPDGDSLAPFPTDRSSGLLETVGARLHGEPERV